MILAIVFSGRSIGNSRYAHDKILISDDFEGTVEMRESWTSRKIGENVYMERLIQYSFLNCIQ